MNRQILGPLAGRLMAALLGLAPASALAFGHRGAAVAPSAVGYGYSVPVTPTYVMSAATVQPLAVAARHGLCQPRAQVFAAQAVTPSALSYALPATYAVPATAYAVSATTCGTTTPSAYTLVPVAAQFQGQASVAPANGYTLMAFRPAAGGIIAQAAGVPAGATPYLSQLGASPDVLNQLNTLIKSIIQSSLTNLGNGSLSRDALLSDLRSRALNFLEAYLGSKINPSDPALLADLGHLIDAALGGSGVAGGGAGSTGTGGPGGMTINTPQVNIIINTSGTPSINSNPTAPSGGASGGIIQDPSRVK